jgi:hypothetical protein
VFATSRRWLKEVFAKVTGGVPPIVAGCTFCGASSMTDRSIADVQVSRSLNYKHTLYRVILVATNADTDDPVQTCLSCARVLVTAALVNGFSGLESDNE